MVEQSSAGSLNSPRVLLIGAQGTLGRICVDALRSSGFDVIRAGRRAERAGDFRLVDLDHPASVRAGIAGMDLVVSTVRHPAHTAERIVAGEGGVLLNVASLNLADRAEVKAAVPEPRGLVVLHAGVAPGVHSLVAKDLLARHPEADGVEVALTFSLTQASGRAGTTDFAYPALTSARRHPTRVFLFAAPIGRRRCMLVGGAEIGFFGEAAEGRQATVYLCLLQRPVWDAFLVMNAVRLLSRVPQPIFQIGRRWTAGRTTREPRRDIIAVTSAGRPVAACTVAGSGDYVMTASATGVFARALLDGRRAAGPTRGVWGAEELFDLADVRHELERRGIDIAPTSVS